MVAPTCASGAIPRSVSPISEETLVDRAGSGRSVDSRLQDEDRTRFPSKPHIGQFSWEQQTNDTEHHDNFGDFRPPELLVQENTRRLEGPVSSAEASDNGM